MSDNTVASVLTAIEYGEFETYKVEAIPGRKQSPVWSTFRKIRSTKTKDDVKNGMRGFYYCTECQQILERDITNGTGPLLSHQKSHERKSSGKLKWIHCINYSFGSDFFIGIFFVVSYFST